GVACGQGGLRVEVFLDRRGEAAPAVQWPAAGGRELKAARRFLASFLDSNGALFRDPDTIRALFSAWHAAPTDLRRVIRLSRHFAPWLERARRARSRGEARAAFLAEVESGRASLDLLHHPLLPYQRAGTLHLAFGERALL